MKVEDLSTFKKEKWLEILSESLISYGIGNVNALLNAGFLEDEWEFAKWAFRHERIYFSYEEGLIARFGEKDQTIYRLRKEYEEYLQEKEEWLRKESPFYKELEIQKQLFQEIFTSYQEDAERWHKEQLEAKDREISTLKERIEQLEKK